jgi:hypothetical protein
MKIEDRFYIQACVEDAEGKNVTEAQEGEEPGFYGVYERLADGTSRHLADFKGLPDAEASRDAIVDILYRWTETDMPAAVNNPAEMLAALRLAQQALNTARRFKVPNLGLDSYQIATVVDNAINAAAGAKRP